MDLLRQLCELHGIPGREEKVREFVLSQVADVIDSYEIDAMGNLICHKKAATLKPKKGQSSTAQECVMVACHMDEIGFYVRAIDAKGFLRLQPVGGFDPRQLFSRRVVVRTQKGDRIGILYPSGPPLHVSKPEDRKNVPEIKDFFVDMGLSAEKAKEEIRVGDPVSLYQHFETIGDLVSCKAMDNRVACWVGIRLLQQIKKPTRNLAVVFTVQEEVGLRGALTSAFTVAPTYSVAVDVTLACDTPHTDKEEYISEIGNGVCIKVMDSSTISDYDLVQTFIHLAEQKRIKHQMEILPSGGTDAGALQRARSGSKAITLSIPTRYIHTICETIHPEDLQATLSLLRAFCES